jgi:hypothetical protein
MKINDPTSLWLHIPIILIKIIRILTKKPSGQPKNIELKLLGRSIKIETNTTLGSVRLEVITPPTLTLDDKNSKLGRDYQPKLYLGEDK